MNHITWMAAALAALNTSTTVPPSTVAENSASTAVGIENSEAYIHVEMEEPSTNLSEEQTDDVASDVVNMEMQNAEETEEAEQLEKEEPEKTELTEPIQEEEMEDAALEMPVKQEEKKEESTTENAEEKMKEPIQAPSTEKKADFEYDIASYTTKYSQSAANANRNYNMKLASDSINGIILQPGDSFSYNQVILEKSNGGKGYKEAGIPVNGKPSTGIGGGICQISSTLYEAALYSGMTITRRQNHSAMVGYMPAGRDATVSWGGPDLQFRNDLDVPMKIDSYMENGVIKIRFLSTKPRTEQVEVSVSYDAKSDTYILKRYQDGILDYTAYSRYKK